MEELCKKLENLKQNLKNIYKKINHIDLKKNIENIFSYNRENDNFNDILFLIQYSLKYKNICRWPDYNDLFVINYNMNDNFRTIVQKNKEFFKNYESFSLNKEIDIGKNNINEQINYEMNNTKKNILYVKGNNNDDKNKNEMNNHHNVNRSNNNNNDGNNVKEHLQEENKKKEEELYMRKEKEKKINTYFNGDISLFDKIKLQIFMYFVLNNYRVKILVDSLSALNRPINVIYINCPNNKEPKKKIYEKIGNFFASQYKVNDVFVNNKDNYQKFIKEKCSCSELSSSSFSNFNNTPKKKKKSNYVGGYNPINNTIWLCANNITNFYKLKYILTHELIHAFDFARANIDMYNCHHIACSEIRAYNMSNQCNYFNSKYFSGDHDVFNYLKSDTINNTSKNKCIYNNVYSSLYQYKPCSQNTHNFINDVFEKCIHDYWPFMCAPENDSKYKPSKIFKKDY
ncbi:metalloprotease, putative [Plasmodium gallinaceum]|uniref:Metalloprotease, putative n=1 Tax=Plasmodium gallinaceum TaxID=5849 RepID=A0A1J1GQS2_PLAGA|nr:metalloprotease, putative [Plasmodium gallinaceum]CRG94612.1 metalloprotease, putative [Plasmodium gallinaceum]